MRRHHLHLHRILILLFGAVSGSGSAKATPDEWTAVSDLLAKGNAALSRENFEASVQHYASAIQRLPRSWFGDDGCQFNAAASSSQLPDRKEMELVLSLHTNYGTALSSLHGGAERAISAYRTSCLCYRQWQRQRQVEAQAHTMANGGPSAIEDIAAQSFFLLGMTHQDLAAAESDEGRQQQTLQNAARAYAAATEIDPNHWSSFANMAVVLADVGDTISLGLYEEAIMAYQKAIGILTGVGEHDGEGDRGPTDPPENSRGVVAELHYRIGLCLVPFLFSEQSDGDYGGKQCTLSVGPTAAPTTRTCLELSAFQFHTALSFDPGHEGASNALTIATADATFGMSTDARRVQTLFDEYSPTFEKSLVDDLVYNGFARMRRSFDKVMLSEGIRGRQFPLAIDAGCGTGLAGEVFRNITQKLVGIDLSPSIIELAKESRPNLYSEFVIGDIQEILRRSALRNGISLLVAADTFPYFNDLNDVFEAMAMSLEEGGYIILSLENASYENEQRLNKLKPEWSWQLLPSGRVAHRKQYAEDTAREHSLVTVLYETLDNFREENGVGVRGHLFVLKKQKERTDEL